MNDVFDPENEITIKGRKFYFRPLVHRQFKRFLSRLPKLAEDVSKIKPTISGIDDIKDSKDVLQLLLEIGPSLMDRVIEWLSWSLSDKEGKPASEEWLDNNIAMTEYSRLVLLFIEVNDLKAVFGNFQKVGAMMGLKSSATPTSSQNSGKNTDGPAPSISSTS